MAGEDGVGDPGRAADALQVGAQHLRPVSSVGAWAESGHTPASTARSPCTDALSFVWSISVSALQLLLLHADLGRSARQRS